MYTGTYQLCGSGHPLAPIVASCPDTWDAPKQDDLAFAVVDLVLQATASRCDPHLEITEMEHRYRLDSSARPTRRVLDTVIRRRHTWAFSHLCFENSKRKMKVKLLIRSVSHKMEIDAYRKCFFNKKVDKSMISDPDYSRWSIKRSQKYWFTPPLLLLPIVALCTDLHKQQTFRL